MTNIRFIRTENGFTQEYASRHANISIRNYQKIEAVLQIPNVNAAIRISKVLNTTVEKLFPVFDIENQ